MTDGKAPPRYYAAAVTDPVILSEFGGVPHATLIRGRQGTGKTVMLIDRIRDLLERGTAPDDILIICASALSEQDFKLALGERLPGGAALPQVLNPRRLALDILANDEAVAQTGRHPRLLAEFEQGMLLQDLKTTGIKPKRLREILRFFYKSWTELADENPDWLMTSEERTLYALLKDELAFLRCMLEPELANTAVKWLRSRAARSGAWRYPQVLVDDYQLLSRASQLLAHLLATEGLTVTGSRESSLEVFESFPYEAGLEEFLLINPDAECVDLSKSRQSEAIIRVRNSLLSEEVFAGLSELSPASGAAAAPGSIVVGPAATPEDEFIAVADRVKALLASGTKPGDVAIVAFTRIWARHIADMLRAQGIPAESHYEGMRLAGDTSDPDRSLVLRIYTALRLVADPNDDTSWRCWCGFGDYLGNSTVFTTLKERFVSPKSATGLSADPGSFKALVQSLAQSLAQGEGDLTPRIGSFLDLYREGKALVDACEGLAGAEAIGKIISRLTGEEGSVLPSALRVPGWDTDGLSCTQLVALYERRLFFPQLDDPTGSVLITSPPLLNGKRFKTVLVCGFVNGFAPTRDYFNQVETSPEHRTKIRNRYLHMLSLILGCTYESLVLTYFERIDLWSAERLNLSIQRIRAEKGQRVCVIPPSELLDLMVPVAR